MNMDYFSQQIEAGINNSKATVTGDGSKFEAVVISEQFSGLSLLKKHQLVYATLNEHITSGAIHALTIKAYTPEEWQAQQQ
ncbi:MAG: BolA/IbaG family iron-sulfur metabolism protein [Gammaproteobacteria bacterium]|nr:BolA/IbaG family iron-sulfur metabolism protein [Gammaproteobacteria bacterium]MDQ7075158.1 BolA/IbaG family iron-sulfur metabolism protein [Gammaproteobacteria bacterium]